MKRYYSIGELFSDYREFYSLSQTDFAGIIKVDLRTVQRWEKNLTLVKSEKEEEIVLATLMPYQLIHNLNATIPIPTLYSFTNRKYSLSNLNEKFPNPNRYKEQIEITSTNLRPIDYDLDIKYIDQFIVSQKGDKSYADHELIKEAIRLLPELNFIFIGKTGYYAGHCITLPLKEEAYKKLRNREITNKNLRVTDLISHKQLERPIFYKYDITGDCNETIFYVMTEILRYFRDLENKNYLLGGYTERDDNYQLHPQIGLKTIWEDKDRQEELNSDCPPRFFEGNLKHFLFDD